jgi:glycosyltransferase involved in cell wall biosynthesis
MIFCPWDLQHLHLIDFWRKDVARARDAYYRLGCRLADCVALGSDWCRDDVIAQYQVPRSRTAVVRVAPPTQTAAPPSVGFCASVREKFALPPRFMFYPAVTWPHKNHLGLLTALAKVYADHRLPVELVCSGQNGRGSQEILRHAQRLGVVDRVRFLGFVERTELCALYRLAEFCIFPSLFEGAGLPVLEAFDEGCPVAASNVASIPEYAGDAALLFDPRDRDSMADAILTMANREDLRRELAARGKARAGLYSWTAVAQGYKELYCRLAARSDSLRSSGA